MRSTVTQNHTLLLILMHFPVVLQTPMAEAVDLEYMREDLSLDAISHNFLKLLLRAEIDILDPSAGDTDKMVMMVFIPAEVVVELSVRMNHPGYYPTRIQFFEIAIYGGKSQPPEPLLHTIPDILGTQVYTFIIQHFQENYSFGR
jgi:hypothetical protein